MKKALISGITGQDGSYLAEFLLQKGYEVHGILRRSSSFNTGRIEHLYFDEWVRDMKQKRTINLHYGDMTDSSSLIRIIQQVQPDEIYNLAAQSHVKVSFDVPEYTAEADAVGTLRMLEAVRILGLEKKTRIYQASTSELFGKVQEVPQKETTPFYPRSPYGVAKQYGFWITKNYRESYGMFAVNGILFNHESERRGETFVTRKISLAAARIAQGEQDKLYLGNLDARRDWGYAKDYVECMWLILQHDVPEDFVIATGEMHTVREFATLAFKEAGIELRWEGEGVNEKGIDVATGKALVEVDPKYFRPSEVEQLLGDPTKAKTLLNWNPRKTSFEELVSIMVRHDMEKVKRMIATEQIKDRMEKNAKIYVAGHHGLVGSAIWKNLQDKGYTNLVGRTHKELDLLDGVAVRKFFDEEQPEYVFLAAAFVGGIMANSIYRADFIYKNLQIQQNVIGESFRHNVKKLLFLGSTCIYPRDAEQPMKEDVLLTSPLEYTNEPYAIAKIAGLKMCESFNLQYGTNYIAVMPTNLYGPNDNFDLERSHVLPAMIRKIHLAHCLKEGNWEAVRKDMNLRPVEGVSGDSPKEEILAILQKYGISETEVTLWGTGTPLREFLWSEEMADASVFVMEHVDFKDTYKEGSKDIRNCHINIGTGKEITIRQLAERIVETVGYQGKLTFDSSKPDGTMRKLTDPSKLHSLGWHHKIEIEEGVQRMYEWYLK